MCTPIDTSGIFALLRRYVLAYPLIQRDSIPQTSLVIILTHTRMHTRNCKSLYGS